MNKKGMLFSIMAVILIAFFISSIPPPQEAFIGDNGPDLLKVESLNSLILDLDSAYLDSLLVAISEQAINASIEYVYRKEDNVIDVDETFFDVLINGTIEDDIYLQNALPERMDELADFIYLVEGVDFVYNIHNVELYQQDVWDLEVVLNMSYAIKSNVAVWGRTILVNSTVDIRGFQDPLLKRLGVNRTINNFFEDNVETNWYSEPENIWTYDRFKEMFSSSLVAPSTGAPDFLDRLRGDFDSDSVYGYEGFLNASDVDTLISLGVDVDMHVDHLYDEKKYAYIFDDSDTGYLQDFKKPPYEFLIHDSRLNDYNLCDKDIVMPADPIGSPGDREWADACPNYGNPYYPR